MRARTLAGPIFRSRNFNVKIGPGDEVRTDLTGSVTHACTKSVNPTFLCVNI